MSCTLGANRAQTHLYYLYGPKHVETEKKTSGLDLPEFSARAAWSVLWRRKYYALTALMLSILGGVAITARTQPVYEATATIQMEPRAPQVLIDVNDVVDLGHSGYWAAKEYYQTQYRIVRSRPIAMRALARLGHSHEEVLSQIRSKGTPKNHPRSDEWKGYLELLGLDGIERQDELVQALEQVSGVDVLVNGIRVTPTVDSQLARISFSDVDPARAARIVNAVVDAYIEYNIERKVDMTRYAVGWLSEQTEDLKAKLEKSELQLHEFKTTNSILSTSLESKQSMVSQSLGILNEQLAATRSDRLRLQTRLLQIERKGSKNSELGAEDRDGASLDNEFTQNLKIVRAAAQQEEAELALRYTAEHPRVLTARKKIKLVGKQLEQERNRVVNGLREDLRAAQETEKPIERSH